MTDSLPLLQEFYREKLAALLRHQAGARLIRQYDANNTYQYIINREETQLAWVAAAILELGGAVPADSAEPSADKRATSRRRGRRRCSTKTRATPRRSSIGGGRASSRWPTRGTAACSRSFSARRSNRSGSSNRRWRAGPICWAGAANRSARGSARCCHPVDRVTAAVALGSNLGDRAAHLAFARARLEALLSDCRFSTVHETEPVGVVGDPARVLECERRSAAPT